MIDLTGDDEEVVEGIRFVEDSPPSTPTSSFSSSTDEDLGWVKAANEGPDVRSAAAVRTDDEEMCATTTNFRDTMKELQSRFALEKARKMYVVREMAKIKAEERAAKEEKDERRKKAARRRKGEAAREKQRVARRKAKEEAKAEKYGHRAAQRAEAVRDGNERRACKRFNIRRVCEGDAPFEFASRPPNRDLYTQRQQDLED